MSISYQPIGHVRLVNDEHRVEIDAPYRDGLVGLSEFKWIMLVWHADQSPILPPDRYSGPAPYKKAPETLGVFATRSPLRPNPVCVSVATLVSADAETGVLRLGWIDCEPNSPILDIKPYQPAADRVENPGMPAWCADWPQSIETSGDFDWASIFNC